MLVYRLVVFVLLLAAGLGGTILWGPGAFLAIWFFGGLAWIYWMSRIDG